MRDRDMAVRMAEPPSSFGFVEHTMAAREEEKGRGRGRAGLDPSRRDIRPAPGETRSVRFC